MKLTNHDKFQLIIEIIATTIMLLMFNLTVILLIDFIVKNNPAFNLGITTLQSAFFSTRPLHPGELPKYPSGLYLHWWVIIPLVIFDVLILDWRIKRRCHLIQINHIISELHYIANGHFGHRITFKMKGKSQGIINSINVLVNNVINSIHRRKAMERSKNELITNVSHDIRTPLTSIIGYLGLIESHRCNLSNVYKFSNIAYFKAKQMKDLANELFEYTQISQSRVPMKFNQVNVHQMLEQLMISNQIRAKKVGMKIQIRDDTSNVKIKADPAKLGRALNDLISNAIKYGHDGKNIYLTSNLLSNHNLKITVANDGKPIPKASLSNIFSRFYRGDKSRNQRIHGSGLGLAIVYNIVRLHKGTIKVKSDRHLTQFMIYLQI